MPVGVSSPNPLSTDGDHFYKKDSLQVITLWLNEGDVNLPPAWEGSGAKSIVGNLYKGEKPSLLIAKRSQA